MDESQVLVLTYPGLLPVCLWRSWTDIDLDLDKACHNLCPTHHDYFWCRHNVDHVSHVYCYITHHLSCWCYQCRWKFLCWQTALRKPFLRV